MTNNFFENVVKINESSKIHLNYSRNNKSEELFDLFKISKQTQITGFQRQGFNLKTK